jgi:hypothetical protein
MSIQEQAKLKAALTVAFVEAIEKIGLDGLKSTSMFGSNERVSLQKAA